MLSAVPFLFAWGLPAAAVVAAIAALVFAPPGAKRILIEAAVLVGVASAVYGHGASYEQALCQARLDARDLENEKAVVDAQARARAKAASDIAELRAQLDALAQDKAASDAELQNARDAIAAAPAVADQPAPQPVLDAIRGRK